MKTNIYIFHIICVEANPIIKLIILNSSKFKGLFHKPVNQLNFSNNSSLILE